MNARSANAKYAVIVRSPTRILPSYYHHVGSHLRYYPDAAALSCVSDIVRSERYGIDRVIDYYRFFQRRRVERRFVVYYEDLLADTLEVFRGLLRHAGYKKISEAARRQFQTHFVGIAAKDVKSDIRAVLAALYQDAW